MLGYLKYTLIVYCPTLLPIKLILPLDFIPQEGEKRLTIQTPLANHRLKTNISQLEDMHHS